MKYRLDMEERVSGLTGIIMRTITMYRLTVKDSDNDEHIEFVINKIHDHTCFQKEKVNAVFNNKGPKMKLSSIGRPKIGGHAIVPKNWLQKNPGVTFIAQRLCFADRIIDRVNKITQDFDHMQILGIHIRMTSMNGAHGKKYGIVRWQTL